MSIHKCPGNSDLQAILMADHTGDAVTLSSTGAICMYPLLGLQHRCAYWLGGDYKEADSEIYKPVTVHSLPGQDSFAKAVRSELGRQRSLDDQQCFITPSYANWGKKSDWTLQICRKGLVECTNTWWGRIRGDWQTLRRTIPIIESESVKSIPSH